MQKISHKISMKRLKNLLWKHHTTDKEKKSAHKAKKEKLAALSEHPEYGEFLVNVPLLSSLDASQRGKLGSLMEQKSYAAGSNVITQGEDGTAFYVLRQGEAVVVHTDSAGVEDIVAHLGPGDYFGEQALINKCVRNASIRCTTEAKCLVLTGADFAAHFNRNVLNVQFTKRRAVRAGKLRVRGEADTMSATRVEATDSNIALLHAALHRTTLLADLDVADVEQLLPSMWVKNVASGTELIKQGDEGECFYIIQQGTFNVLVSSHLEDEPEKVGDLGPGMIFGELAVVYHHPRNASVVATSDSIVWVADRHTYRKLLVNSSNSRMTKHLAILKRIPMLDVLTQDERETMAEALVDCEFEDEQILIAEESEADALYIISVGTVEVTVDGQVVADLGPGDFVGEQALLSGTTSESTCTAKGHVECLTISQEGFTELLGPFEELMGETITVECPEEELYVPPKVALSELEVVGNLGEGAYGLVQMVRHRVTGQTFAMKRFSKQRLFEAEELDQVINERDIMAKLHHPMLVNLVGAYKDADHVYLLIDLCQGGDLYGLLRVLSHFPEPAAAFYAAHIVLVFEHIHSKGVIHRDLKPENVLVDRDGYIKLVDFGLAKVISARSFTMCGTPCYLSPEMLKGSGHGKGVDWWTLGILIYELLAGYTPYEDNDQATTCRKILAGNLVFPSNFSKEAVDLITRLLEPKPSKRLGCLKGGASLIKRHRFFAKVDWSKLLAKTMKPPVMPVIKGDTDLGNFFNEGLDDEVIPFTGDDEYFAEF